MKTRFDLFAKWKHLVDYSVCKHLEVSYTFIFYPNFNSTFFSYTEGHESGFRIHKSLGEREYKTYPPCWGQTYNNTFM